MEEQELVQIIEKNPLAKGVTFSGGEPFAQAESFGVLAKLLKDTGYEVASYSGYTFEELLNGTKEQKELLRKIDVLIDGRYEEDKRSLNLIYRGSTNQRIIDVPESLAQGKVVEITGGRGQENIYRGVAWRHLIFIYGSYRVTNVGVCPV